jgi:hypothetical protein
MTLLPTMHEGCEILGVGENSWHRLLSVLSDP